MYKPRTLLNCEITQKQDAKVHYLTPAILASVLYIVLIACDTVLVYSHYKDENPVWASLTLFFIFAPALISYILIISNWELWPYLLGCGRDNFRWFVIRTLQHCFFVIWALWRYAERIFWSIEAVRSETEFGYNEATEILNAPRTIELYLSLQAFLHALPQMLLQLYTIMRRNNVDMDRQTADLQFFSFIFNLFKLSVTVVHYQRFKKQKLAGKDYPWNKRKKDTAENNEQHEEEQLAPVPSTSRDPDAIQSESRRSSDFYLEPLDPDIRQINTNNLARITSVLDGPPRQLYQEFNVQRLAYIKGLPEDDFAGKTVATLWWFCFLLARILAISAFAFFYPTPCIWLISVHAIVAIAILIYDAKSDEVTRGKALFFLFLGLIYIFCLIEFKIQFKKTKYIYILFFGVTYAENFIMSMVWWFNNVEDLENDYWFRYIFYLVTMCSIISLSAMVLYLNVNKPKKVIVGSKIVENR